MQDAYATLLDAAAHVAQRVDHTPSLPDSGWDADRILADIALVDAATLATVASGAGATYDTRIAPLDGFPLDPVIADMTAVPVAQFDGRWSVSAGGLATHVGGRGRGQIR